LFTAGYIFDRYLSIIGHWNYPREHILKLAISSLLLAAKLEQPISPSFSKMINLIPDDERKNLTKEILIDLEGDILIRLGFDFNYPCPIQTMERFLRILNFDFNKVVYDMCYQICKFQMNDSKFLAYRPS
jgi:hypothetical protein